MRMSSRSKRFSMTWTLHTDHVVLPQQSCCCTSCTCDNALPPPVQSSSCPVELHDSRYYVDLSVASSLPPLCCKQYTRRQKEKKNNNEIKAVLVKQGGQASMAYWDTQGSSDPVIHKMITWSLLRLPTQAIIVVVQQRR